MPENKILKRDYTERKTFAYSLDDVNISFTLRTDVKKEMKAALAILAQATTDITAQLEQTGKEQAGEK